MKQLLASPSLQLVTYPASATAQSAEFASADCVTGLNEIGQISVSNISGDPQDVERIVALKADEQGASWYRIITMYEDQQPDNWRVQAILYGIAAVAGNIHCTAARRADTATAAHDLAALRQGIAPVWQKQHAAAYNRDHDLFI